MKYKCYIPDVFEAYPLYFALEKNILSHDFQMVKYHDPSELTFSENEKVIILIDVYTMAKMPGKLWTIPNISFTMKDKSLHYRLFFHQSGEKWEKVKLTSSNRVLNLLAKIIILEKFDMEPDFSIPETGKTDEEWDAYLLEGSALFEKISQKYDKYFDLVEEWYDFTENYFPTYLWVSLEKEISPDVADILSKARDLGVKYLPDIAEARTLHPDLDWLEVYRFFTDHCVFHFNEKQEEAIKSFWQYGFYYGEFEYIPEIKYAISENGS
jgi:predicted solute-binding protein